MELRLTRREREWRDEVRSFLDEHVTTELIGELATNVRGHGGHGPHIREFRRKLRERGWYGVTWPTEYGGLGGTAIDQLILIEELRLVGVPGPDLTVTSVAPMIMRHGTEKNKQEWLPGMARGEITVAVGYSEPDAGTDLANLRTSAHLEGDEWVINGSKTWNSFADEATHEWLCVRTSPTAARTKGISVIMVPLDSPGIEIRPLITWAGSRTNEVFFTGVRVPRDNLIGEVDQGWSYIIAGALYLERAAVATYGDLRRSFESIAGICRDELVGGQRLADRLDVRLDLAQLDADIEIARLFAYQIAADIDNGGEPVVLATEAKVFTTELRQRIADFGTKVLGMYGQLDHSDPLSPRLGSMERLYRESPLMRFGGGTNEVMRDVIAQVGHGLPSYRTKRS